MVLKEDNVLYKLAPNCHFERSLRSEKSPDSHYQKIPRQTSE